MLEIIIIFVIGRHFRKRAQEAGLKPGGWAAGGAIGTLAGFYGGFITILLATDAEAILVALIAGLALAAGAFFFVRSMLDKKIAETSMSSPQGDQFSDSQGQGQGNEEDTF